MPAYETLLKELAHQPESVASKLLGASLYLAPVLLRAGFYLAFFAALGSAKSAIPYEVISSNNVMIAMRDGIKLATDIYFPASNRQIVVQPFPIILMRSPYNKTGAKSDANFFAARGYIFVAQDTRGRYESEGVWHFLTDDGRDGVDTAEWLGRQTWSNGKIGTIGTSYVGGTQHAMALEKAPQLETVIPVDAVSNTGYQSMRNAGAFEMRFWNWIYSIGLPNGSRQARDPGTAAILQEMSSNRILYLNQLPLRRGTTPLKLASEYEEWLVEAMKHGGNDSFWSQNNILDQPKR